MLAPIIKALARPNDISVAKAVDALMLLDRDLNEIGFDPSSELEAALNMINTIYSNDEIPVPIAVVEEDDVEVIEDDGDEEMTEEEDDEDLVEEDDEE